MGERGTQSEIERDVSRDHTIRRRTVLGVAAASIAGATVPVTAAESDDADFTAVRDGDWSDSSTWTDGAVPTQWSTVSIPAGVTVTVASTVATPVKYVEVGGTLRHDPATETLLRAETIETRPESRYEIGTATTPVAADASATVEFVDDGPIDEEAWPDRKNKGLVAHGAVEIVGAEKTPWTGLAAHATADDSTIDLAVEPTGWKAGDRIVLPGLDPYTSTDLENEDEVRTISSVEGTTVTVDEPLDHDHVPPKSGFDSYVLNLSRNVVFTSQNDAEHRRGHVMIASPGSDVRHVRFDELGRTNKAEYLTDPVRGGDTLPAHDDPNPAARYPFHYHHTGIEAEPHHAEGLVVEGGPGWGVVNHHAHAEVTDSITYDVLGAGFVAEGGNERGSFERCFALRSAGSGDPIDSRAHGAHGGDPAIDDFGHAGHGFWLQSPLVEVVDNVAAGHRHQAFVWWLRPLLDGDLAEGTSIEDSRVTDWPNLPMEYVDDRRHAPMLAAIEQGRFSGRDELLRRTDKVPSTFVAIEEISGNTAFGAAGGADFSRHNFKWQHERFSDFNVVDDMTVYNVGPFVDADGQVQEPELPRHRAAGHQGRGGSVGVSFRYTSNVSLRNSHLCGIGRDHSVGVPFHDYLWTSTVEDCTIEGWDWGIDTGEHRLAWIRNNTLQDNEYDVNWSFDNVGPAILENNDLDSVRNDFEKNNQKASEVFDFGRTYGVRVDGRSAYVEESAPEYVPFPDRDALGGINNIESTLPQVDDETNLVGLTNAELQEEYDISIGGALLPDDAVSVPWMEGAVVDPSEPRFPPTSVHLDATEAEPMGGFEIVDEPDAAGDSVLACTGDDAPASLTFECAAGTYTIHGRIRPDAWNGDDVSFRIDGGEWYTAEKLKTPVGFRWHGASPNGGEDYEWDLSAGIHTLEFKSSAEDLRIDEIFVGSDAAVLGAYGASSRKRSTPDTAVPTAADDSVSVENGGSASIDVLSNDSAPDGLVDPASVRVEDPPAHGTASPYHGGSITYGHDGSETRADSFTYTVADGDGARSAPATVSVSIDAPEPSATPENTHDGVGTGSEPGGTIGGGETDPTGGTTGGQAGGESGSSGEPDGPDGGSGGSAGTGGAPSASKAPTDTRPPFDSPGTPTPSNAAGGAASPPESTSGATGPGLVRLMRSLYAMVRRLF